MQCACVVPSSASFPALQQFSTFDHERHDFQEKVIEHKMCVLIFSTILSETFLILRRTQRDIIINVHTFLLFLSDFNVI